MVTREQAIRDLRRVTEELCGEIERELAIGLKNVAHMEEARHLEPVIRSWLSHLRRWNPDVS